MGIYGGPPEIITDGLVLHLDAANKRSYPGSGNTWYDLSNSANNFILNGVDHIPTSPSHFSMIDNQGDYVYKSSTNVIGGLSNLSLSMWIKVDTVPQSLTFLSYATSTAGNNAFLIIKNYTNTMRVVQYNTSEHITDFTVNDSYYLDQKWHNMTFIRNSSSVKVYIDGIERGNTNSFTTSSILTGGTLVFGQEQDSVLGGFQTIQDVPGDISIIKIYNKALTPQEVLQNYNATKARFGFV